jgi:hypothetical protein
VIWDVTAFAKIRRPDERFVSLQQSVLKMEEQLGALERLQVRIAKRQADMVQEMADVGASFSLLGATEVLGGDALEAAGRTFDKGQLALKQLVRGPASLPGSPCASLTTVGGAQNDCLQLEYAERLRDHQLYCACVKVRPACPVRPAAVVLPGAAWGVQEVLYQRDLRHLEHEDLVELLEQARTNRDKACLAAVHASPPPPPFGLLPTPCC